MPVKIHGKDYYTVAERIQMLNDTYKDKYSINTELLKCSDSVVIMKATLTFHLGADDVRTFVGHAMEEIGSSKINELSALECAETSAIGRSISAAGMAGSGSDYCSADELANALHQQSKPVKKPDVVVQAEKTFGKENVVAFPETDNVNTINFGKHKGSSWAEVPIDYIDWLISKGSVDWQKEEAQQEKDRRNPSKPKRMAGGMSEAAVMEEEKLEEIPF